MSMNLAFEIVDKKNKVLKAMGDGCGYIDFPYQTTTEISYKVLRAKNLEEQLTIIREDLTVNCWEKRQINRIINTIKRLMNMSGLKIVVT